MNTIGRYLFIPLLFCAALAVQAQTAAFTYRKSAEANLHICEMKERQLVHKQAYGMATNILYFAQIDCSGTGQKAGSIGIRLQSLSALGELRSICRELFADSVRQREDVSMSFSFDNGERLTFDSVYVHNLSTPMLNDIIVVVDLLGVHSDVVGSLEMSALTHAYLVKRFGANDIVKIDLAGHSIPFTQWKSAATLHDMFRTLYEKIGSNIYDPDFLKDRESRAADSGPNQP